MTEFCRQASVSATETATNRPISRDLEILNSFADLANRLSKGANGQTVAAGSFSDNYDYLDNSPEVAK